MAFRGVILFIMVSCAGLVMYRVNLGLINPGMTTDTLYMLALSPPVLDIGKTVIV